MTRLVIGLTGGIGTGKSAVSDRFSALGIVVADADVAARAVVAKGTPQLARIEDYFGAEILLPNGDLDRAQLRSRIFSDVTARRWLEAGGVAIVPCLRRHAKPGCVVAAPKVLVVVVRANVGARFVAVLAREHAARVALLAKEARRRDALVADEAVALVRALGIDRIEAGGRGLSSAAIVKMIIWRQAA